MYMRSLIYQEWSSNVLDAEQMDISSWIIPMNAE